MNDFCFIAQIVSAGKDGFVKIQSVTDIADCLNDVNDIYLDFWGKKKKFIVEEILEIKNSLFLKFLNFNDDRDISVLLGHKIFISENDFKKLPQKNFSDQLLIGCKVFRNGDHLGIVKNLYNTPANDVIEILKSDGEEILIPYVDAYFEMMDVKNKILVLKPDAGFYDDED